MALSLFSPPEFSTAVALLSLLLLLLLLLLSQFVTTCGPGWAMVAVRGWGWWMGR
jgi:hypothetical protein